jgi:hypothetical protein
MLPGGNIASARYAPNNHILIQREEGMLAAFREINGEQVIAVTMVTAGSGSLRTWRWRKRSAVECR